MPPSLCLILIQSVTRGSSPTATPGTVAAFLLVVLLILILAAGLLICIRLGLLPGRMLPATLNRGRPASGVLCHKCGYDLRASPDRCPECGEPRRVAGSPAVASTPSRVLRRVSFQAGKDVLEISLWRELMPCVEALAASNAEDAELLFAISDDDTSANTTSEALRDAAERCVRTAQGLQTAPSGHGPTIALLQRARQFARSHPYAHIVRSVHGRHIQTALERTKKARI